MMQNNNELKNLVEAVLFLHGEPLTAKKIAAVTAADTAAVLVALQTLQDEYKTRGLRLMNKENEWQLVTSPDLSSVIEKLIKSEYTDKLSKAALEVLAIVAYKGPLTRAEIEFIRGVNSIYSLRNLTMRGLIEKKENPKDGRSHLYLVTFDFLRHFGFTAPHELPRYEEFRMAEVPAIEMDKESDQGIGQPS